MIKNKKVILLSSLLFLLISFLFYLSFNPIHFVIKNYRLNKEVSISAETASVALKDFSFYISIPELKIQKQEKNITVNNVDIYIDPWLVTYKLYADIKSINFFSLVDDKFAANNEIFFDGKISAKFFIKSLRSANIDLKSVKGGFKGNDHKITELRDATIKLEFKNKTLAINDFIIEYNNGLRLVLEGYLGVEGKNLTGVNVNAKVNALPVNDLKYFWPETLYPEIRKWVVNNIYGGSVEQAVAKINFNADDLKNNTCKQESVDTMIIVKNTNVLYLEDKKPIENIDAKVHIDCTALEAEANASLIRKINLFNIKFRLPFDSLKLEVSTKFKMQMSELNEFIPNQYIDEIKGVGLDINQPSSILDGSLLLSYPLKSSFLFSNLEMNIDSEINRLVIGEMTQIVISNARLKLSNLHDQLSLSLTNNKDDLNLSYQYAHDAVDKDPHSLELKLNYVVDSPVKLNSLEALSGKLKVFLKINNKILETNLDATNAVLFLPYIGYTKDVSNVFNVNCIADVGEEALVSKSCQILGGSKFSAKLDFFYNRISKEMEKFELNNVKIDQNIFSVQISEKNNISSVRLKSNYLDLSKLDYSKIPVSDNQNSTFNFSFDIREMLCKNNIILNNIRGEYNKNKANPPQLSFFANSDGSSIELTRALKEGKQTYILTSNNISRYMLAANLYRNIKKGSALVEVSANKNPSGGYIYTGKIQLTKFYFTNNSPLIKIIRGILSPIHSFSEMVESLRGGSLPADTFTSNITLADDELNILNGFLEGPSYQIKISGFMDFKLRKMKFKGIYIPNFHGINGFISSLPILGWIINGGKDSAFIGANFTIRGSFDKPETFFNPLSLLTPGFLRNLL